MARTRLFERMQQLLAVAQHCERTREGSRDVLERLGSPTGRRAVLRAAVGLGGAAVLPARAAPPAGAADVAVVGAGFAGLYCASVLAARGAHPTVFEADQRVGGRVWSLRGVFPGQVAERGAELIDTTHVTLRGLANAYGLTLESYAANQLPGEELFYFSGQRYTEAQVVDEFRALVPALREDLTRLSNGPTALSFSSFDQQLDFTPLSDYLVQRGAGPLIRQVLNAAYTIEFGRETNQQSALSLLFFIAANRRSTFTPFGVFSDERFHIVEGNDVVAQRLAQALPAPVQLGRKLLKVARAADGRIRLSFANGSRTIETLHAAAVLTLPAPVMRQIEFDPSLALPAAKQFAVSQLDYGTNSKMMIGFNGRPWYERNNSNGASYSDLPNHQSTWETNPSRAQAMARGVLTDYSGGNRGARLNPARPQTEADAFLTDLERVYPGSAALARRDAKGQVLAHLENWKLNPLYGGAYTNNQPGYFTTLEGLYAQPVGNLYFAGEHTDSFYSYQGFMEGALLSGARAADEVLRGLAR